MTAGMDAMHMQENERAVLKTGGGGQGRDALEGKGPQSRPQKRLDRWLEEVAEVLGGGYCQLQMPLKPALAVRETVAGHRLGALEEGGGGVPPPVPMHPLHPWGRVAYKDRAGLPPREGPVILQIKNMHQGSHQGSLFKLTIGKHCTNP